MWPTFIWIHIVYFSLQSRTAPYHTLIVCIVVGISTNKKRPMNSVFENKQEYVCTNVRSSGCSWTEVVGVVTLFVILKSENSHQPHTYHLTKEEKNKLVQESTVAAEPQCGRFTHGDQDD